MSMLQDFPLAFAENKLKSDQDSVCYLSWLNTDTEFPELSDSFGVEGPCWEILEKREAYDDEFDFVPVEENWSKLVETKKLQPYAKITERAASLPHPKRKIQPLFTVRKDKIKDDEANLSDEEVDDNDLFTELYLTRKGQSKIRNRHTGLRKLGRLRMVDQYVQGVLFLATTRPGSRAATWLPHSVLLETNPEPYGRALYPHTRNEAILYTEYYINRISKSNFMDWGEGRKRLLDPAEYSIYTPISRRLK
ncbi:uncharacterized protein RHIMIDRAFT_304952 [Rhizopus microsporus ATCC 52813]|uniref:Uncharacterized protein n=2 Tax=Rhizopus microsporus TaxID=58291 RepID=A0A2G4SZD4_RHIZD|nr:uncharacterized protein RHIMIDRAFT_304952 [Rhizopus microsporus ATCC 52813]PHZ14133.1 hypothetical protein RHIMIDRAFT_304952 [Rhizopus microsporus ATCC 52813]